MYVGHCERYSEIDFIIGFRYLIWDSVRHWRRRVKDLRMSYVTSILKRWKFHWEVWRFFLPPHSFYIWRWGYYGSLCRAYDEMVKYFIDKTTPLYKETVLLLDGESVVSKLFWNTERIVLLEYFPQLHILYTSSLFLKRIASTGSYICLKICLKTFQSPWLCLNSWSIFFC